MAKATLDKKVKEKEVSVLSFEKKLVPSDGYFYGTTWENRHESATPLKLVEKSVRGTISNRLKKEIGDDPMKLDAKIESPNLQTVDNCSLGVDQDTLKMVFTLKVLSGVQKPSACNSQSFQRTYSAAAESYIASEGFMELAVRYATNIANGRFLWRNRVGAEHVEIVVKDNFGESWLINANELSTRSFDDNTQFPLLAEQIASALSGETDYLLLEITAYVKVGKAQEVYPSEELILDKVKGKGKKSKVLYAVDGIAGMHSQKIGNALRTIDTWYPEYEEAGVGPIAVEPYGAVTSLGKAFRSPKDKADFYTLFDKWSRGGTLDNKNDEHYVMATLVRGGVFGGKGDD